jgi:hypothetical protein
MSGLEIAAAVFGIIGGIASTLRVASDLRKRYANKKKGKSNSAQSVSEAIAQRLERVENQLRSSELTLQGYQSLNVRSNGKPIMANGLERWKDHSMDIAMAHDPRQRPRAMQSKLAEPL